MIRTLTPLLLGLMVLLSSCVSKKSFTSMQSERDQLKARYDEMASKCEEERSAYKSAAASSQQRLNDIETKYKTTKAENDRLSEEVNYLKGSNTNLLDRLEDMSVLSQASAESIKQRCCGNDPKIFWR